jgi:hypothetical protein
LVEGIICALSGAVRNKNQRQGVAYIFRPSTLFHSETWLHGRVDSPVKFPRREVASFNSNSVAASRDGTPVLAGMPPSSARTGNNSARPA